MGANDRMMGLPLCTEQLVAGHGHRALTVPLDLAIAEGQLVALLGNNGIGKSSLLYTLGGLLAPIGGQVLINGKPLHGMSANERSRAVALVLSGRPRTGMLRVREVVAMGRMPWTDALGRQTAEDERIVDGAMRAAEASALGGRTFEQLSDGEAQKVMIARALAQRTTVLLLDEPTAFLDVAHRALVMRLLRSIARDRGVTVVFSTHDLAQALRTADRILLFQGEGKVWQGSPREALASDVLERAFQIERSHIGPDEFRLDPQL